MYRLELKLVIILIFCTGALCAHTAKGAFTPERYLRIASRVQSEQGTGGISGTVVDSTHMVPIRNVAVEAQDSNGNFAGQASTDESGNFEIPGLGTGFYFVLTYNEMGYIDEIYNDVYCLFEDCNVQQGIPIYVHSGSVTPGILFTLDVGGTITGLIRDAGTGDPLSGIWVGVFDAEHKMVTIGATVQNGEYEVIGLPTGDYYVMTLNSEGYVDELFSDSVCAFQNCDLDRGIAVNAVRELNTDGVNFELKRGGSISGTVRDSLSFEPLESVEVIIVDEKGNTLASDVSDEKGDFHVSGLPGGYYFAHTYNWGQHKDQLYQELPCDDSCDPTKGMSIAVTLGNDTPGVDFLLQRIGGKQL